MLMLKYIFVCVDFWDMIIMLHTPLPPRLVLLDTLIEDLSRMRWCKWFISNQEFRASCLIFFWSGPGKYIGSLVLLMKSLLVGCSVYLGACVPSKHLLVGHFLLQCMRMFTMDGIYQWAAAQFVSCWAL